MVRKCRFVDIDVVNRLRQIGLSWKIIAEHPEVNVSRDVLLKWRKEVDFVEPKQSIDSDYFDKLVVDHTLCQPRRHGKSLVPPGGVLTSTPPTP